MSEVEDGNSFNQKGRSLYYHRYSPQMTPEGGSSSYRNVPAYSNGGSSYGNAYGASYGSPSGGNGEGEDSAVGAISLGRILRVCMNHWMTIFVFLVLGLLAAFVIYQLLPTRWKATAYYEMSIQGVSMVQGQVFAEEGTQQSLREAFNTRKAQFDNNRVRKSVIDFYRTEHAASTVSTEELIKSLKLVEVELVPMSKLVAVTIETGRPELSADLVNAYIATCKTFMDEQNKAQAESAVAWLTAMLDTEDHILSQLDAELLELRKSRRIESLQRERENTQSRLSALDSQVITLGTQVSQAKELMSALSVIKEDPGKFGMMPESMPRSTEIVSAFQRWQDASVAKKTLLTKLTENHPDVKLKAREEDVFKEQFVETAQRAYETGKASLELLERQTIPVAEEAKTLRLRLVELDTEIIGAEMAISQLERARETEVTKITSLRDRTRIAEMKADENAATIKPLPRVPPPEKQSSPNPYIVFTSGVFIGLLVGVFFVLLLDHMEDKLSGVPDIEQRLRLKALSVFPHLRRKLRVQVALTMHEDPFSQYAESMAGLRNLLDSPRYHDLTKVLLVMSTQPAEGKTCTSSNLAIAYAQSGQKTLLVDFDMRRPRVYGIYGKGVTNYASLPHVLAKRDATLFDTLPVQSEVPNLSVVFSRTSSTISPSVLMGTNIITEFFDWARQNFDHVIIDSPPFGLVGDVIVLANLVDSVILVATPDKTRFGPIQFAARRLTEVGARVLGVVVNNVDFGRWAGFSKYETRYGYSCSTYSTYTDENHKKTEASAPHARKMEHTTSPDDRPVESELSADDE
ncbi:MAG: polysaccharide biosynthesis tyrosine autokinase [Kiritimatiellia bacterium]